MNEKENRDPDSGHVGHEHLPHEDSGKVGERKSGKVLTIRSYSGLSGDMCLAGLLRMTETSKEEIDVLLGGLLPQLVGSITLEEVSRAHIAGWHAAVSLPHEHSHRSCADILHIIENSTLSDRGKTLSAETFKLLAEVEGKVHSVAPETVHFHEVGALDSIIDICLSCELFARLAPDEFIVSPIPVADGRVHCAHGILPTPAPAVLMLLTGLSVAPFQGEGETLTPTAAALLHSLGASFGPWPTMHVEKTALVYGDKYFTNQPNGASFAFGYADSVLVRH